MSKDERRRAVERVSQVLAIHFSCATRAELETAARLAVDVLAGDGEDDAGLDPVAVRER